MQVSFNGIENLKEHEGFRAEAYKDTGGIWTIGYGSTHIRGDLVRQGDKCTKQEATSQLQLDLSWAQTAINKEVKVLLRQNQFDSLVSFVYNIGEEQFHNSTLLRLLNQGDYTGAAKQFDRWVRDDGRVIPGLVSRRKVERSLFES